MVTFIQHQSTDKHHEGRDDEAARVVKMHSVEERFQSLLNVVSRERLLLGYGIIRVRENVRICAIGQEPDAEQQREAR
jgi:hypothetical protein